MKLKTTRSPALRLDFTKFLSCYPYLSLLKKFHKATGEIKVLQPRHDDPKTEALEFKLVGDSFDNDLDLAMQELIGRLCGRHCWELKNHPSHSFGRRDEDGVPYELGTKKNHSPSH